MKPRSKSKVRGGSGDGLIDALAQAAFATMAVLTEVAADHDLSLTQLRVLAILRDRRLRMKALADYLGLEKSTMSGLIDRAARRGLITRSAIADDGRAMEVQLAENGARLAERVFVDVRRSLSPMMGALRPDDRRRLQALLEKMVAARSERQPLG